jgi:hypothetical protein
LLIIIAATCGSSSYERKTVAAKSGSNLWELIS